MPGMIVDPESGRPVLANGSGGLSGPALSPIALRCVYEIARAVRVPIIGTGGVTDPADAVAMLSVGATAIGVGSAIYHRGPDAFSHLAAGLQAWCVAHGVSRLEEIRGRALGAPKPAVVTTPPPFPAGAPTHG